MLELPPLQTPSQVVEKGEEKRKAKGKKKGPPLPTSRGRKGERLSKGREGDKHSKKNRTSTLEGKAPKTDLINRPVKHSGRKEGWESTKKKREKNLGKKEVNTMDKASEGNS